MFVVVVAVGWGCGFVVVWLVGYVWVGSVCGVYFLGGSYL